MESRTTQVTSGWRISTSILAELPSLQTQHFLLVNFFEFMAALWPHVAAALNARTFDDVDGDFQAVRALRSVPL